MGSQACDLPLLPGSPDWWKADDDAEGKGQRHPHHRCRDIQIIPSISGSAALTRSTLAGKSIGNSPLRPCSSRAARTASLVAKYTLDPSWTLLSPWLVARGPWNREDRSGPGRDPHGYMISIGIETDDSSADGGSWVLAKYRHRSPRDHPRRRFPLARQPSQAASFCPDAETRNSLGNPRRCS